MSARLDRPERVAIRGPSSTEPSVNTPLPDVSRDLIQYLERVYPNLLPPFGTPAEDVILAQGHREVVEHLKEVQRRIEEENTNVLLKTKSTASGAASGSAPGPAASG